MLRRSGLGNPFAVPLRAGRLLYPVAAIVLVGLTAATVAAALPGAWLNGSIDVSLTSGGKFAARIPGAETLSTADRAAEVEAFVLPTLALSTGQTTLAWLSEAATDVLWDEGSAAKPTGGMPDRHSKPKGRADSRPLVQVLPSQVLAPQVLAPQSIILLPDATSPRPDDGLLPKVVTSARSLWSMTAAAGGSLLSHVLPQ